MKDLLIGYFVTAIMFLGLPLVDAYIKLSESIFLNTHASDATGLEAAGDFLLIPTQYLLAGKEARMTKSGPLPYTFVEAFDYYSKGWQLKTIAAAALLPCSLAYGTFTKAVGYLVDSSSRTRYMKMCSARQARVITSNLDYYRSLGIAIESDETAERLQHQGYSRDSGAQTHMATEKAALAEIAAILKSAQIPFWLDCGTCLGAYRYGGIIPWDHDIDIAILQPDSGNVRKALQALDPDRYVVQDWSCRGKPETLLKVYVKESHFGGSIALIDIYHYAINRESGTLDYIFSANDSIFFPAEKKREEHHVSTPVPYAMIFPLKKADFDGIELYVPNQTREYLHVRYGPNIEPSKVFDASVGRYVKVKDHPYWNR